MDEKTYSEEELQFRIFMAKEELRHIQKAKKMFKQNNYPIKMSTEFCIFVILFCFFFGLIMGYFIGV